MQEKAHLDYGTLEDIINVVEVLLLGMVENLNKGIGKNLVCMPKEFMDRTKAIAELGSESFVYFIKKIIVERKGT